MAVLLSAGKVSVWGLGGMRHHAFKKKLRLLYKGAKVYGPYRPSLIDGRKRALVKYRGRLITKQYAKFKMEIKLGRFLKKEETVDHKDGNVANDRYSNLQLMSRAENAYKSSVKAKVEKSACIWCGTLFRPSRSQRNSKKTKAGPFCSRTCSGKYGASVQNGGKHLKREKIRISYCK